MRPVARLLLMGAISRYNARLDEVNCGIDGGNIPRLGGSLSLIGVVCGGPSDGARIIDLLIERTFGLLNIS